MINGVCAEGEITMDGIVQDQGARPNHVLSRERLHGYTADGVSRMEESTWDTHIWKYRHDGRRDRDEECGMQDMIWILFSYRNEPTVATVIRWTPKHPRPIPDALSVLSRPFLCE